MPVTYTNRRGKLFYLHQGTTRAGNPQYYFALKAEGNLVAELPAGYEIEETPNAQVFLRRRRPLLITAEERATVVDGVRALAQTRYTLVDVKDKVISVYVADENTDHLLAVLIRFSGEDRARSAMEKELTYSPRLRFVLTDHERRLFICERSYFLGSVDDFGALTGPEPLEKLVQTYAPHLGNHSFYELY